MRIVDRMCLHAMLTVSIAIVRIHTISLRIMCRVEAL
jgi:hypothetical protein